MWDYLESLHDGDDGDEGDDDDKNEKKKTLLRRDDPSTYGALSSAGDSHPHAHLVSLASAPARLHRADRPSSNGTHLTVRLHGEYTRTRTRASACCRALAAFRDTFGNTVERRVSTSVDECRRVSSVAC